jgi:hypothetical protein
MFQKCVKTTRLAVTGNRKLNQNTPQKLTLYQFKILVYICPDPVGK